MGRTMVATRVSDAVEAVKPRLRGRLHQAAFLVSIPVGLVLVALAPTAEAKAAAVVYALGATALYGTSAAYHIGHWSERARHWMQRLDHSMIYVLIAATYTPVALLALHGGQGVVTLIAVWTGAVLGVVLRLTGLSERRGIGVALYFVLGWAAVISFPALVRSLGPVRLALVVAGGLAYTLGAVGLGARWPDPSPRVFGYHEVWHTATLVAGTCFAVVVFGLVLDAA